MSLVRNIKLVIAYDGTAYAGWQRQKAAPTIQGVIEEKIAVMTDESVTLLGAGRTDAGVHALGMVANFQTSAKIPVEGFRKGLNSLLPEDIRVRDVAEVGLEFHSRYDAVGKIYFYDISIGEIVLPTERLYRARVGGEFDPGPVKSCLKLLLGKHDFTSFEASGSRDIEKTHGKGAVREMFTAKLVQDSNGPEKFRFIIAGDGFLRHMVRNIVGTLVEVGQGKRSIADFQAVLTARDRATAGPTMPASGLFLQEVYY